MTTIDWVILALLFLAVLKLTFWIQDKTRL